MDNHEFQNVVITDLAVIKEQLKPMQDHLKDGPMFRDKVTSIVTQTKFQWYLISGVYLGIFGLVLFVIRKGL